MKRYVILPTTISILLVLFVAGCKVDPQTDAEKADMQNVAAQMDVKARATAAVPVPRTTNFQARKNLAEFMKRTNEPGKVYYVYEIAPMTGKILGYYMASSYPQSVCTFMTPPEQVKEIDTRGQGANAIVITTAMALDGVYYKGGDCPDFFFDYNTDAMVVLDSDALTRTFDQPLDAEATLWSFKTDATAK